MNIPLVDFLEALTYDGLFDRVQLTHKYIDYIKSEPSWDTICYIDIINPVMIEVYYPLQSWIQECKRIQAIDETLAANKLEHLAKAQVREKQLRLHDEVSRLKGLMMSAALQDNVELVNQYSKQIKELTNEKQM